MHSMLEKNTRKNHVIRGIKKPGWRHPVGNDKHAPELGKEGSQGDHGLRTLRVDAADWSGCQETTTARGDQRWCICKAWHGRGGGYFGQHQSCGIVRQQQVS